MINDSTGKEQGRAETRESLGDSTDPTQSSRDAAGESSIDDYMMKYRHQQKETEDKTSVKRSNSQVKTDEAIQKIQGSFKVTAEEEELGQRPKIPKPTPAIHTEGVSNCWRLKKVLCIVSINLRVSSSWRYRMYRLRGEILLTPKTFCAELRHLAG